MVHLILQNVILYLNCDVTSVFLNSLAVLWIQSQQKRRKKKRNILNVPQTLKGQTEITQMKKRNPNLK